MRLTDDAINENAMKYIEHIKESEQIKYLLAYINGEVKAREFYENQNCGTCKHHAEDKTCLELDVMVENDFGCREWETKK